MFASEYLIEGDRYTRKELQQKFHIQDATINTGVFKPSGYLSIWLFVTEQKTKDRPQLKDYLSGDTLYWDGQPEGRTDKLIIEHELNSLELLIFYRKHRNEFPNFGFKYEGCFCYKSHTGSRPSQFVLRRVDSIQMVVARDILASNVEEANQGEMYREGKRILVLTNKHERNPNLRTASIKVHGTRCQVCDFSFVETYGNHGEGFIEVHHLYPVSKYVDEVSVNPSVDMAVVCSNCHRMIHRNPEKPLSLEEIQHIVAVNRNSKTDVF